MLPPKRVTWASRYSRSKTSRASRSGSCMISPPFSQRSTDGASSPTSLGSTSARIGSPPRRRQDQQPLDDVAQLAHVARPVVALQRRQRVVADRPRRQAGGIGDARAGGRLASSGMSSRRSLSGGTRSGTTFSRWNSSSRNAPAAISSCRSRAVEASTRDVDLDLRGLPPSRVKDCSCSTRASRLCSRERQVGDLVEQQRAAMGHLERARDAQRVAVGLAVGAEQLDLQPLGAACVDAVDHDERPVGPLASPGGSAAATVSLPAPDGAGDQHAAAGRRHPLDLRRDAGGRARASRRQVDLAARAAAQAGVLAPQPVGLDGAIDRPAAGGRP